MDSCDCGPRVPGLVRGICGRSWLLMSFCGPAMSAKLTPATAFVTELRRLFWLLLRDPPVGHIEKHSRQHRCCSSSETRIEQSNNPNPTANTYILRLPSNISDWPEKSALYLFPFSYLHRKNRPHSPTQPYRSRRTRWDNSSCTTDKSEMELKIWSPSI